MKSEKLIKRIELIQEKAKLILHKIDLLMTSNKNRLNSTRQLIIESKKQISDNYVIIEEQLRVIKELNELKNNDYNRYTKELLSDMNYETVLDLTKNKEIAFDEKHPYINNIKFVRDLMGYFIEIEEYEECINLQKLV